MNNLEERIVEAQPQSAIDSIQKRNRIIVKTSIYGITANVLLALMKAIIGITSNSIAILLDAVNNITDAGSSIVTIVGTRLAAKKPDKKHPWGHGRIEYLSAMILGALVISAGASSLIEAIHKIITPDTPSYTSTSLIIVGVCVLVKIVLGRYTISIGEKVNAETLVNSGKDASMDAVISSTTLIAALIFIFTGVSLEAWLGCLISVMIVKAGVDMLLGTISELLGQRANSDVAREVKKTVESFPQVHGVYDMVFHDYGPNRVNGSLHIEVDDTMMAPEISDLIRRITLKVYSVNQVALTAIGIYSMNTQDDLAIEIRDEINKIAMSHEHVLQVHGFYIKPNSVQFDVIIDFDAKDRAEVLQAVVNEVKQKLPGYYIQAFLDADYSFTE